MPLSPSPDPDAIDEIAGGRRRLTVGDGHRLWWTERGDPAAPALLVLHGGPGGRTREPTLAWWQGLPLRVLAFDQRGCGRSQPSGSLQHNTLAALVEDIEALRVELGVGRWALAGGSWGARLALAYAAQHPQRVNGLFLRSPFLGSRAETARYIEPWFDWLGMRGRAWVGEAAAQSLSRLYQAAPASFDADTGFTRGGDPAQTLPEWLDDTRLARAWAEFDDGQSLPGGVRRAGKLFTEPTSATGRDDGLASWRVHAWHALAHWGCADPGAGAWPEAEQLSRAWSGPVSIVAGAEDACCDPALARRLATLWPQALLQIVPGAGHRLDDPLLAAALAAAARAFGAPP
ncbi:alpha/beta fold hydrolase [Rivibacter subsaxonicus]|uniref:Proline iminopeptidase n=1 Tax=Rivibacter subsaxonicus TaxID=457575 RepID=A0A4Q7VND6_9BURK|nr:alpha/beta fold hydrolase [Rivibacter subsaxonicus]RZT97876.1 prolyl aminopeptidase [Rivibacter subsaxonicus]